MPYDRNYRWIEADDLRTTPMACGCTTCAAYERETGLTPQAEYLAQLEEPAYGEDGYDQRGFNREGFNREGFDRLGYDREGHNSDGYNRAGFDREGYDYAGRDSSGYDREGYNWLGFNREGYNHAGLNSDGYDRDGFDYRGRDADGFDRDGYDRDGYNRRGFNREGIQRPCDCTDCKVARDEAAPVPGSLPLSLDRLPAYAEDTGYRPGGAWRLNSYNYTPPLAFRRCHGEDKDKVPFFGLEIEMTSPLTDIERQIGEHLGMSGDLLYFKHDGSVDGFEMVSHPMTYRWACENFPWRVVEDLGRAGASVNTATNGLHVHVSRSGFADEAHMYRFARLWYRNSAEVIRIAGRDGGQWGNFRLDRPDVHFRHSRAKARQRHTNGGYYPQSSRETGTRYVALNLTNQHTIEARIFAATTEPRVLMSRVQLVAASVEYTRKLPVGKVAKGGWNWDQFMLWLEDREDTYPELAMVEAGSIIEALSRQTRFDRLVRL